MCGHEDLFLQAWACWVCSFGRPRQRGRTDSFLVKAKQSPGDRAPLSEGTTHGVCTQKTLITQPRPDPRASPPPPLGPDSGAVGEQNAPVSFCEMRHSRYLRAVGSGGEALSSPFFKFPRFWVPRSPWGGEGSRWSLRKILQGLDAGLDRQTLKPLPPFSAPRVALLS